MLFNLEFLYILLGIKVDKLFFFLIFYMNFNNNIDIGLFVGCSIGGKFDSVINKFKIR